MEITEETVITLSEAVQDAMRVRRISENDVRRAIERATGTELISDEDRVCEGSPEPGRILLIQYKELADNRLHVLFVYEK